MRTDDFVSDEKWIAQRLNLEVAHVQESLNRLIRLNLVKRTNGQLTRTTTSVTTTTDVPSKAIRTAHSQCILQALTALEKIPVDQRDITSVTFTSTPEKIPLLKELVRNFRRQVAELTEDGPRSEVFNLNIQFVPVTLLKSEST